MAKHFCAPYCNQLRRQCPPPVVGCFQIANAKIEIRVSVNAASNGVGRVAEWTLLTLTA